MRALITITAIFLSGSFFGADAVAPPQPIKPDVYRVTVHDNQVWATYKYPVTQANGSAGRVEQVTSDTIPKMKLLDSVLSPSRDRYFYLSMAPGFEGLHRAMLPNFDFEPNNEIGVDSFRDWGKNDAAMYLHVYRLSGEEVAKVPLLRSYWGEYQTGRWLDDHWICIHDRRGKIGGNYYSLFVNTDTGAKRLIGMEINDDQATGDGRFVTFTREGLFFVNFAPVYPISDEPLPDFGDENGWKSYKEKYILRKQPRPWSRINGHRVSKYELATDGKKAILLDHCDWNVWKPDLELAPEKDRPKVPLEQIPAPELVVIDLDKIEKSNDPKQYSSRIPLPKENRAQLIREDKDKEFRVYAADGRTVLWRKSFAELAADAP